MLRSQRWKALVWVVASLIGSTAAAQEEVSIEGMSTDALREDVATRLDHMQATLTAVETLRDQTRDQEQDLTKVRCINDKLAAIQGFLRLSADSQDRLEQAISRGDHDGTQHQYTLIVISSQRVQNLQNEASQCAGDILTFAGSTERQTTVDPTIPNSTDLTASDQPNADLVRFVAGDPLPETTPFQ